MNIGTTVGNYFKKLLILGGVLTFLVASMALVDSALAKSETDKSTISADEHIVSIFDRGEERVIVTKARTIRGALKAAQINVSDSQDVVEPGLDSELVASKYNVNIYRARPVTVVDGALRKRVTTAQQTPQQIAKAAGLSIYPEDKVTTEVANDLLVSGADMVMEIDRANLVNLKLYGKQTEVRTRAATVSELLTEKSISLGENDSLSVPASTAITNGMLLELWRDGKQTLTQEEDVEFTVDKIQDANREVGYRELKTPGQKGRKTVTYEIDMKNGKEVSRKEVASITTKQPVNQVEIVGAKFNYTGGPLSEAQISALGMCESGMTASRNSGNGFYGAFQFMPSTWRNVAPGEYKGVMPHQAPLEAQKQAVQNLLSRSSIYTQFPGCARKMQAQGIL